MTQTWDPRQYARNARFVSDSGRDLIEWLDPGPGERVLDLGCGDGALTEQLAARGCVVVGVDSSPEQVAAARARGIDARVARAEDLLFEGEFDAVFSNAVLHWIRDVPAVLGSVHRALRPGGRFVADMGGAGNVRSVRSAMHAALRRRSVDPSAVDPWIFPTEAEYRGHLEAAGFRVERIEHFARPTELPGDLSDWIETFARPFLAALPIAERRSFIDEVTAATRDELWRDGRWVADYVRLRFVAHRDA